MLVCIMTPDLNFKLSLIFGKHQSKYLLAELFYGIVLRKMQSNHGPPMPYPINAHIY